MPDDRLAIEAPVVRRLIDAQFPRWAGLPLQPLRDDGWDNRTFRLGPGLKVRLPRAARYAAQPAKEHRWLPRLAPWLPVPIPQPLALGAPGEGHPFPWSVQGWIEGTPAASARPSDARRLAADLGAFLRALRRAPAAGGPAPGPHSFLRGGALATYDGETRRCIAALGPAIDGPAAMAIWEAALAAPWTGPPVWVHGDVAPGNLIVREGRLAAVIDFGCMAVGDPSCDLAIAWTAFDGAARAAFREAVEADAGAWARARGWALWKALLVLSEAGGATPAAAAARRTLDALRADPGAPGA